MEMILGELPVVPRARATPAARAGAMWWTVGGVAVLLGLLFLRVWQLGITHTDDAMWVLRSHSSFFGTIIDWAHDQGRIWAYVSGTLIMSALVLQGSVAGELLRLGSFALFFLAFHAVAAVYCGRRVALLAAGLFLAFYALKWDGSLLTTYPMLTWPSGVVFCAALLLGRRWCAGGPRWQAFAAAALLFLALFNNEGVSVTFIALALLSVAANAQQLGSNWRAPRCKTLLLAFLAAAALYALIYIGWRLSHPSVYPGNTAAPLNVRRILVTWYHFSTSGSVLHELTRPLSLWFMHPLGDGERRDYALLQYGHDLQAAPLALLAGALSAALVWRLLASGGEGERLRNALRGGLLVGALPIVPVALVGTYQVWAMDMGVRAYSHTVFAHFGWSLALAALLLALCERWRRQRWLPLLLALLCGVLATLVYRADDAIADDMRPEAGRWNVVNRAIPLNRALLHVGTLWVPGLAQRTQYGQLYPRYWEDYVAAHFHESTDVAPRIPDINDQMQGLAMLDYAWDAPARRMPVLMMAYRKLKIDGSFLAGRVVIDQGGGAASAYRLQYKEQGQARELAVAALRPAAPGVFVFDPPPSVDPASVRLLAADGRVLCAIRVPRGLRVDFKTPRMARPAFDAASFLDGGWYALENQSVWSRGGEAHIRIPRHLLPAGPLRMELDAGSFTSLGYGPGVQTMAASVDGVPIGRWEYRLGATPDIALDLPPSAAAGDVLDLRFDIAPTMSPKRLGLDPRDERELGLLLKAVTFLPK